MDVVEERLEREYNLNLIATSPSVIYRVYKTDGEVVDVDNPAALPPTTQIDHIEEPYVRAEIMVPKEYVGAIMDLCQKNAANTVICRFLMKPGWKLFTKCLCRKSSLTFSTG